LNRDIGQRATLLSAVTDSGFQVLIKRTDSNAAAIRDLAAKQAESVRRFSDALINAGGSIDAELSLLAREQRSTRDALASMERAQTRTGDRVVETLGTTNARLEKVSATIAGTDHSVQPAANLVSRLALLQGCSAAHRDSRGLRGSLAAAGRWVVRGTTPLADSLTDTTKLWKYIGDHCQ
jgi:hypothetical protein